MKLFQYILYSALTGVLIVLAFPNHYYHHLAFFSLVPLLHLVNKYQFNLKLSFFHGLVSGAVVGLYGFWWITHSMIYFGGMPLGLAVLALFFFSLLNGIPLGLFAASSSFLISKGFSKFLIFPVMYAFTTQFTPTVFPWTIGNAKVEDLYFAQIADVIGVMGLNVVLVFSSTAILTLIYSFKTKTINRALKKCIVVLTAIGLIYFYGLFRIGNINKITATKHMKVAILQGNLGIEMLESNDFINRSFAVYAQLSRRFKDFDLLVWPESSIPLSYTLNQEYKSRMDALVNEINSNIIFGSYDARDEDGKKKYYSTAFLIGPQKEYQVYDKIKLLPFGDYMPLEDTFPILRSLIKEVGNFTPGKEAKVLDVNGIKISPSICYEILIGSLNRSFKTIGSQIIVNMTNDAWFGPTEASNQHMSLGRIRAIELRLPIIRSTNTGVSAFINVFGQITNTIPQNKMDTVSDYIPIKNIPCIYARLGDSILYLYFLICFLYICFKQFIERRIRHD